MGGPAPWPPTFSTGVYALGAGQVGRLLQLPSITTVGDLTGLATVALWAATTGLHALAAIRGLASSPESKER